jgi:hypothetical protein
LLRSQRFVLAEAISSLSKGLLRFARSDSFLGVPR